MNVEAQLVVGFVVHLILAERDVADGKVIEVPPVGGLEARHGDVGLGVELFSNPAADRIQLHAVQTALGHALRQHPEEIAHAAGRLYVPTDFDTKEKALSGANAAEKGLK